MNTITADQARDLVNKTELSTELGNLMVHIRNKASIGFGMISVVKLSNESIAQLEKLGYRLFEKEMGIDIYWV